MFQRAPTLGGECYELYDEINALLDEFYEFQRAPTLGGECYDRAYERGDVATLIRGFNGHPPLGVNATMPLRCDSQRHSAVSTGTHPWG